MSKETAAAWRSARGSARALRMEPEGPALPRRGRLYGAGRDSCPENLSRLYEKTYASWVVGTVDSGTFAYETGQGQVLATPGVVLFGNASEWFTCRHAGPDGNRRSIVAFDGALVAEMAEALCLEDVAFTAAAVPPGPRSVWLYAVVRRLVASEEPQEETAIELLASALSIGRRPRHWRTGRRETARVLAVVRYLERHYAEPQNLEELARMARLSRFHFIRIFRRIIGVSPHQFLIGLRLRAAAERLRATDQPITGIALDSGFNDISHFNRTFRRAFGMAPNRWR